MAHDRGLSRRRVLQAGGSIAAGGLVPDLAGPGRAMAERLLARLGAANLVKEVVRKQDMLALRFEFYNLRLAGGKLEKISTTGPAVMVVCFAPQHIGERAFFESSGSDDEPPDPRAGGEPAGGGEPVGLHAAGHRATDAVPAGRPAGLAGLDPTGGAVGNDRADPPGLPETGVARAA